MSNKELHPYTEIINKAQKIQSKNARQAVLNWLAKKFPLVFNTSISIQPLKIGIIEDIFPFAAEEKISRSKLREALVIFTRRLDYLACLKAREWRIDLEGNQTTVVTEEEAEKAALKIKKRIESGARNARAVQAKKTEKITTSIKQDPNSISYSRSILSHYPERPSRAPIVAKTTPVLIRHKNTKSFDPEAVARLKEKLGISRKELEEEKELS